MLLSVFAILVIISSVMVIRSSQRGSDDARSRPKWLALILAGVGVGFLSGLAGIGGGFLILPTLILFAGLRFTVAVGSALPIIAVNSLAGFLGSAFSHPVNWLFLASVSMLAIFGIFAGDMLASDFSGRTLKRAFGWSALVMGVWILVKECVIF
jgi:uncharacterized membrane protein YfcA